MLKQFLNHIDQNNLFQATDKILLAVSGGLDSVVMFQLFRQAGFEIGVAHCNFQLRRGAADGDEAFVRELCFQQDIPFHPVRFDTEQFAAENGQSIQLAARELRYRFFKDILEQHAYHYVATAHHVNDSLETVLLNLVRGTGLDGLTGISVKRDNRIRPLLFASREEIESYALSNGLIWREDASNSSDDYSRNLLRNRVIPILKQLNPSLEKVFKETQERVRGASSLAQASIGRFKMQSVKHIGQQVLIRKEDLMASACPAVLLWEIIKEKGFNYNQCRQVTSIDHLSGKVYQSVTHELTVDRDNLILSERKDNDYAVLKIDEDLELADNGSVKLTFEILNRNDFALTKNAVIAQLDFDKLHFPLTWRPWKEGDHFVPIGMKKSKKLSDFLIDEKVPVPAKKHVTVLESAGTIVWIVGFRVSDKFKVTDLTQRVVVIKPV